MTYSLRVDGAIASENCLWSVLAAQRDAFLRDGSPPPERRRSDLLKLRTRDPRAGARISKPRSTPTSAIGPPTRPRSWRSCRRSTASTICAGMCGAGCGRAPGASPCSSAREPQRSCSSRSASSASSRPGTIPASLCLMPLATAIAAGNRAMLKPSEHTPKTSELIGAMLRENLRGRAGRGRDRRRRRRRSLRRAALRPPGVHRQHERRARRHAGGEREPGPGDARARRQVAGDRRPGLLAGPRRQVDRLSES